MSGIGGSPLGIRGLAHVGIAVPSIDAALPAWESLGFTLQERETLPGMGLEIAFLEAGGTVLELLEPTAPDTPVGKFLASRRGGIHHLAFLVPDLEAALRDAEARGLELIDRTPRDGSHGLRIAFLHPRSFHGVLVELCQKRRA